MDTEQLHKLIEKYLAGTASEEEKNKLNEWYRLENEKTIEWASLAPYEETQVQQRMLQQLQRHVKSTRALARGGFNRQRVLRVAAVVTGVFLVSGYFLIRLSGNHSKQRMVAATATHTTTTTIEAPVKYAENRYILLPDSSTIVLHSGSQVSYAFSDTGRQVYLTGEAYFDVKHQSNRPFIIHTGNIVTTVLGTAFNINAWPNQNVIVSVTRGKVRVVDETRHTQSILMPREQLTWSQAAGTVSQQKVEVQQAVSWTNADLQFDGIPFGQLAEKLARRYNVTIRFNNPLLKNCLITGGFIGTESIEQVLQDISGTLGTTYSINNNAVVIDGKECM